MDFQRHLYLQRKVAPSYAIWYSWLLTFFLLFFTRVSLLKFGAYYYQTLQTTAHEGVIDTVTGEGELEGC